MAELAPSGLVFDPAEPVVDWDAADCRVLANPEWLKREPAASARVVAALPSLPGHVWVATSGSTAAETGHTRWVALSREAFFASAASVNAHLEATSADVWIHALPTFHVGGLGILVRARLSQAKVVAGVVGRWDAFRFRSRADETHATLTALVPSQVHDLVAAGLKAPRSLRAAIIGGARLDPELCQEARGLGWPCLPSYGLTETCSQVATAAVSEGHSAACRQVLPILSHASLRVNDEGRLEIRAASLLTVYADVADAGVRVWDPKADGWFETEDLARLEGGGVEVLGRASDSVKVLGEMVSLPRIDVVLTRWLASVPAFNGTNVDAAVVAVPDARLGHELVAAIACAEREKLEVDASALVGRLDDYMRSALLPFERVKRVVWVRSIPRTALGKCQRRLLTREVLLQLRSQS